MLSADIVCLFGGYHAHFEQFYCTIGLNESIAKHACNQQMCDRANRCDRVHSSEGVPILNDSLDSR